MKRLPNDWQTTHGHLVLAAETFSQDHTEKGIIFVQTLIQRGILREEDPEVIVGVMQAILMLRLFKDKLGNDMFPKIMDLIIDCIAEGLTKPEQ